MCKYKSYKIIVTHVDGVKEIIQRKGVDMTSYKSVMSNYKTVKKEYTEASTIAFIGIGEGDLMETLFTKENKHNDITELEKSAYDIANEIKERLLILDRKLDHHEKMKCVAEKNISNIHHKIETVKNKRYKNDYTKNQDKIKIFDELEHNLSERRNNKNELIYLKNLSKRMDFSKRAIDFSLNKQKDSSEYQYIDEEVQEKLKMMQEIRYNNPIDRDFKIELNEKKFDKVIVDERHRKIICYNKCKKGF